MRKGLSRFATLAVLVVMLVAGLVGGVILDRKVFNAFVPPASIPRESVSDFRLMAEAWNTIKAFYIDQKSLSGKKLAYGAIDGMVDSLGDKGHSRFMPPETVNSIKGVIQGQFVGVGIELQTTNNQVTVVAPLDNSPAQAAGVRPGDIIVKVDDHDTTGLSTEQVAKLVQGPAGTPVRLGVLTPSTRITRVLTLKRRNLPIRNVSSQLLPGTSILHVRISSFSHGAAQDLKSALKQVQEAKNGKPRGIILDLRSNPGGLLEEAVSVASQFVAEGAIVRVKGPKNETKQLDAEPGSIAPTIPMIILVDEGTASAAEIVSGALQDRKRARLVGERTVGTGTVLRQFSLSDGSAILLATYEWMTPSGRVVWHTGIRPDIEVALSPEANPLSPRAERTMTAAELRASSDKQLLTALHLLETGESK
jgi:carboxyl-terminal processing protease